MQKLILILALGFMAAAQPLNVARVGLTGDPNNPTLTNPSGKAIIATAIVRENGVDRPHVDRGLFLPPSSALIAPGGQTPIFRGQHTVVVTGENFVATTASLDLVVFADGTIDGPDRYGSAAVLAERFKAIVKAGQMAQASQWTELGAMRGMRSVAPSDHDLHVSAYQLFWTFNQHYNQRADLYYYSSGSLSYGRFGPPVGAAATCYDSSISPIYIQVESFGTCSYGINYQNDAYGDGHTLYAEGSMSGWSV